jgi:hypothetical protein
VEPVTAAPVFVTERPVMRWLDEVFLTFSRRVKLPPQALTGDWPPAATTAYGLRVELERREEDGEQAGDLWAAIAGLARSGGEQGQTWQLLACGLAIAPLRIADRKIRAGQVSERCDIHADLIEAFLIGLCKIAPETPGLVNVLVTSARRYAERQHEARVARVPTPKKPGRPQRRPPTIHSGPRDVAEALDHLAARFAAAGRPLDPAGVELIARTVLDGQKLGAAAADLGLSIEAAYKRRQRTETRIANAYQVTARRRASGRPKAVSRAPDQRRSHDATATEA